MTELPPLRLDHRTEDTPLAGMVMAARAHRVGLLILLVAFLFGAVVLTACSPSGTPVPSTVPGASGPPGLSGGLLVRGGRVVRPGSSMSQRLDLLLHLGDGALVLAATGVEGTLAATDTLDVSGLYIHSMNYFDRTVNITPGARAFAMYVVRVGQSPGTRAEWLIGLRGVTELTAADNHPAGPADERVGCYVLEPGEWTDGGTRWRRSRGSVWFPRHLRLHWQYQWAYGVDPYLVATAAGGHVSEKVRLFRWEPVAPDSLRVVFGARFIGTTFRGAAEGEDYVGELSIRADADLAPPPSAPARLVREPCRESDVR